MQQSSLSLAFRSPLMESEYGRWVAQAHSKVSAAAGQAAAPALRGSLFAAGPAPVPRPARARTRAARAARAVSGVWLCCHFTPSADGYSLFHPAAGRPDRRLLCAGARPWGVAAGRDPHLCCSFAARCITRRRGHLLRSSARRRPASLPRSLPLCSRIAWWTTTPAACWLASALCCPPLCPCLPGACMQVSACGGAASPPGCVPLLCCPPDGPRVSRRLIPAAAPHPAHRTTPGLARLCSPQPGASASWWPCASMSWSLSISSQSALTRWVRTRTRRRPALAVPAP